MKQVNGKPRVIESLHKQCGPGADINGAVPNDAMLMAITPFFDDDFFHSIFTLSRGQDCCNEFGRKITLIRGLKSAENKKQVAS